jgi:ribosomal 50S subunit-recycling heat shock protein
LRIDLLLHALCLFKTRSQAARACSEGRVWLNDAIIRPSHMVQAGDRIRWRDPLGRTEQEVEILEIPVGRVSKVTARSLVREIQSRLIDNPWEQA